MTAQNDTASLWLAITILLLIITILLLIIVILLVLDRRRRIYFAQYRRSTQLDTWVVSENPHFPGVYMTRLVDASHLCPQTPRKMYWSGYHWYYSWAEFKQGKPAFAQQRQWMFQTRLEAQASLKNVGAA